MTFRREGATFPPHDLHPRPPPLAMHLFNAARLADDLRNDRLSEKQKMGYFMAATAFTLLFGRGPGLVSGWTALGVATTVLYGVITLAGIGYSFAANARGDGRAFLERLLCLSLPLTLWWVIAISAVIVAARVAAMEMGVPDARYDQGYARYGALASAAVLPLYYVAMARYVGRAAGADRR